MRGFLTENSFPFGNEFFALCSLFTDDYSLPELLKVNVELDVELVAFVNIYPLYQVSRTRAGISSIPALLQACILRWPLTIS